MALSTSSLTSSFSSLTFSSQISQQPNTSLSSKQSKSIFIVPILKTPKLVVSATVASPAELENKNPGNYVKSRLSGGFSVPTIIGTGRSKGTIAPLVLQKGNEEVIINYRDAEENLQGDSLRLQYVKVPLVTLGYESSCDVFVKAHDLKVWFVMERLSCECFDFYKDIIPYKKAWSWQKKIVDEKKALIERNEECPDSLIILQHSPVYTLGTASSEKYLNFDLKNPPFQIYRTERGGEVTYHGPGQLVMYPIINLRNHKMDLQWYMRALEEVVIRVLFSTFSIKASRLEGLTGVWVGDQKLAAIGIRASQWITYHGLALNVTTDLSPFSWIVPCGIQDRQVGSIKKLLKKDQSSTKETDLDHPHDCHLLDVTHDSLIKEFSEVFEVEVSKKNVPFSEISEKNF